MNRFLIVAIAVFLMLGTTGYLFPEAYVAKYALILLFIAKSLAIIMMLANGTFMSTRHFHWAIAAVLAIVLGGLFKILHYAGADELLSYPFLMLFMVYFFHFLFKKEKGPLDILKVVMLFAFLAPSPLVMLHLVSEETEIVLFGLSHLLVASTFLYFVVSGYRQDVLFKE